MSDGNNGVFRTSRGFTVVDNTAARDRRLSEKALGLYTRIASYITMPDGQITKGRIMGWCNCGSKAFEGAWQELKECGYLIQRMQSGAGREWKVEYELLATPREDGIHTFYLNAAGEVTKTNLSRKNDALADAKNTENDSAPDEAGSETDMTSEKTQNDVTPKTGITSKNAENDVTPKTGITSGMPKNGESRRYPQNGYNVNGGNNINTSINKTNDDINNINISHHPHHNDNNINAIPKRTKAGGRNDDEMSEWHRSHAPDEQTDAVIRQVILEIRGRVKVNIGSYHAPYWVPASDAWDRICSLTEQQVGDYMQQLEGYDRPISSPGRFHLVGLYNQLSGRTQKQPHAVGGRFSNIIEHDYSQEEFNELERMLNSI